MYDGWLLCLAFGASLASCVAFFDVAFALKNGAQLLPALSEAILIQRRKRRGLLLLDGGQAALEVLLGGRRPVALQPFQSHVNLEPTRHEVIQGLVISVFS